MNEKESKNAGGKQNYDKSGKKAKRKDLRRMEAIHRQTKRIEWMEDRLNTVKHKNDYLRKIARAKVVLQMIQGGKPHDQLWDGLKSAPPAKEPAVKKN